MTVGADEAAERAAGPAERAAPWVAGGLLALPTVLVRFPPMSDLPLHVAVVGILRHFGDAALYPPGLYTLNLGHPNQLFHLLSALLAFLVSPELACKLVVAAAQVGILVAGGGLAAHLGRSRWTALLLAPLALGWAYFWGLAANLVGLALLLLALPRFDRASERPTWRATLQATAWMVALYLAHESVLVVGCLAVTVFAFCAVSRPLRARDTAARMVPVLVVAAILATQLLVQHRMQAGVGSAGGIFFDDVGTSLAQIPATLFGALDTPEQIGLSAIVALTLFVLALERRRAAPTGHVAAGHVAAGSFSLRLHGLRYEAIALVCAVAYLAAPFEVAGGTLLHQRFLMPAFALGVLCVARPGAAVPRLAVALLCALPLAILFVAGPQFLDAERGSRELDALFARIPLGSAVAYLEADPQPGGRLYNASVGAARVVEARGGRTIYSLTQSVISPVRIAPASRWDQVQDRVLTNGLFLEPARDLLMFHFVLVHADRALIADATEAALQPDAHLLAREGAWTLYEASAAPYPLTSPELPPPDHPMATLREKTVVVLRAMTTKPP